MNKILIVDDEQSVRHILKMLLAGENFTVSEACNGEEALALLEQQSFDLMLSDVKMEPMNGIELLKFAKGKYPEMPVILMTAFGTIETAATAVQNKVFDFISKPFKINELLKSVNNALAIQNSNQTDSPKTGLDFPFPGISAASQSMEKACNLIKELIPTDLPVIVTGEYGTEKDVVAFTIHSRGARRNGPFEIFDCHGIDSSEMEATLFGEKNSNTCPVIEKASGGTLFLDSIEYMPLNVQEKVLEVNNSKQLLKAESDNAIDIDIRFIFGASETPHKLLESGHLDQKLYDSFGGLAIQLDPLRNRREDIIPLVQYILSILCVNKEIVPNISPEAEKEFEGYEWPQNIKEMEQIISDLIDKIHDNVIKREDLPSEMTNTTQSTNTKTESPQSDHVKKGLYQGKLLEEFIQQMAAKIADQPKNPPEK